MTNRKGFDAKKAAEATKKELADITERLEKGVAEVFNDGRYQEYLRTMAKFPRYSVNNSLLIMMQRPDATLCQSYTGWKEMGRFVKKGERGIRILAPAPYKLEREQDKVGPDGKVILNQNGEPEKEKAEMNYVAFKPVSTFDISQTEGEPIPELNIVELMGSVEEYATFFEAMKRYSPVPIGFEDIASGAKGNYHTIENRIAVQNGMSEVQTVKTAVHEMAHAMLHNIEVQKKMDGMKSRESKEVEAESVAYTVCSHYGIDTSGYSFSYVATWSKDKTVPELKESLDTIRQTASDIITGIDEQLKEICAKRAQHIYEGVIKINPPYKMDDTPEPKIILKREGQEAKAEKPSVRKKLNEEIREAGKTKPKKMASNKKEEIAI